VVVTVREPWAWVTNTKPFSALGVPTDQACFVVEQVTDRSFRIPDGSGFQYNSARDDTDATYKVIEITHESLPDTDFASIPRYMSWLISRHGRHTPAALVHDQLVTDDMSFEARKQADRLFLDMMDDLDVPPVQSRVMWAAVTLATRWHGSGRSKAGLVAWAALAAVGIVALGAGLVTTNPLLVVLALVGPALAAVLWGDQYWAGLTAGYALPVVALPALAALGGYWVYWVIEMAVKLGRRARHREPEPPVLPGPIGYQGR
jgi:hypothetical protein